MTPLNRASAASGKANCRFGGALRRSPLKLQKLGRKKRSQCRLLQPSDTLCGRSVCFLKRCAANCWLEPPVISTWPKPQNLSALRFRPFCHDFPVFPWETPLANSAGRIVFRGNTRQSAAHAAGFDFRGALAGLFDSLLEAQKRVSLFCTL